MRVPSPYTDHCLRPEPHGMPALDPLLLVAEGGPHGL